MTYLVFIAVIILLILLYRSYNANDFTGYSNINVSDLKDLVSKKNVKLLDVRTIAEFKKNRIGNAININVMSNSFKDEIEKLNTQSTYIVYCRSGRRSAQACKIMEKCGFTNLYNLKGGILAWNSWKK